MNNIIFDLEEVIFPEFYTRKDNKGNEYVFIKTSEDVNNQTIVFQKDKTAFEAFKNHIHLWEKIKKKDQEKYKNLGFKIAQNLKTKLNTDFPNKQFVVFLELNFEESSIIRFHQIWNGEPLYFDVKKFSNIYKF